MVSLLGLVMTSYSITAFKTLYQKSVSVKTLNSIVSFPFEDSKGKGDGGVWERQKIKWESDLAQMEIETGKKADRRLRSDILNFGILSYYYEFKQLPKQQFFASLSRDISEELLMELFRIFQKKFSSFFKGVSARIAHQLILHLENKVFRDGETILQADHSSPGIFFINSGQVVLEAIQKTKRNKDSFLIPKRGLTNKSNFHSRTKNSNDISMSSGSSPSNNEKREEVLILKKGSFFGEDFLIGKKPLFDYVAHCKSKSFGVQTLFIPFPLVLLLLENEYHEPSSTWLMSLTFRRRLYSLIVLFLINE